MKVYQLLNDLNDLVKANPNMTEATVKVEVGTLLIRGAVVPDIKKISEFEPSFVNSLAITFKV
jgi:hypothetical protein